MSGARGHHLNDRTVIFQHAIREDCQARAIDVFSRKLNFVASASIQLTAHRKPFKATAKFAWESSELDWRASATLQTAASTPDSDDDRDPLVAQQNFSHSHVSAPPHSTSLLLQHGEHRND